MTDVNKVLHDRNKTHGDFATHSKISQDLKFVVRNATSPDGEYLWGKLDSMQKEALEMDLHKIARVLNGDPDYDDHWVDIAGYAQLVANKLQRNQLETPVTVSEDLSMEQQDFSWALRKLRKGYRIFRTGWNGKGLWLELQRPDAGSKMTLPYIYMCYPNDAKNTPGARVPWLASQTDMLAEDWEAEK